MRTLLIINDPPYGTERLYNGLRLALALMKRQGHEVDVFLMADAVTGAKKGQKTPDGYFNIERMVRRVASGGRVLLCAVCMDARGLTIEEVVEGAQRSSMDALAEATEQADKVLVF
ncbi:MAG: DsrE/DsrF/TusD sulfur relay family protein [Lysobacterales bacterium]